MTVSRLLRRCLLVVAALLFAQAALAQPATTLRAGRFLHLSDIHFDPFANPDPKFIKALNGASADQWQGLFENGARLPLPGTGQDTNYTLLKSAMAAVRRAGPYDYVLYSGDYLSHGFVSDLQNNVPAADRTAFAAKTVAFVNLMIGQATWNAPLVAALGNNDSACWDYQLTPGADILAGVAGSLPVLKGNPAATADFLKGGYYLVPHPTVPGQDIAVLSVFWSRNYSDGCNPAAPDPVQAQLAWLTKTLAAEQASGRKVTLLMHILPGIDGFASTPSQKDRTISEWTAHDAYLGAFQALVAQYPDVLVGGYAGHSHMDEFRALPGLAIRVGPAITPRDGNKPAFTVVVYDQQDGTALDYTVRVMTGASAQSWVRKYSFGQAYGLKRYDAVNLQVLAQAIMTGSPPRNTFLANYSAGNAASSKRQHDWRYFGCALSRLDPAAYQNCTAGN